MERKRGKRRVESGPQLYLTRQPSIWPTRITTGFTCSIYLTVSIDGSARRSLQGGRLAPFWREAPACRLLLLTYETLGKKSWQCAVPPRTARHCVTASPEIGMRQAFGAASELVLLCIAQRPTVRT